jgi:hypothetical protein
MAICALGQVGNMVHTSAHLDSQGERCRVVQKLILILYLLTNIIMVLSSLIDGYLRVLRE